MYRSLHNLLKVSIPNVRNVIREYHTHFCSDQMLNNVLQRFRSKIWNVFNNYFVYKSMFNYNSSHLSSVQQSDSKICISKSFSDIWHVSKWQWLFAHVLYCRLSDCDPGLITGVGMCHSHVHTQSGRFPSITPTQGAQERGHLCQWEWDV